MSSIYIPQALRQQVAEQSRYRCGYCLTSEAIVGITSTGRATVAALYLNRPSLVRARQAWVSVGWHLPAD
jgi:hypothetical protein